MSDPYSQLRQQYDDAMERAADLDAALTEARSRLHWQDIETAPKDGTRILGYWSGYPLVQIVCMASDGAWCESNSQRMTAQPDGWMPLPEPPQ